jgi:hypothetical protein
VKAGECPKLADGEVLQEDGLDDLSHELRECLLVAPPFDADEIHAAGRLLAATR